MERKSVMRIGFLVPTDLEAQNLHKMNEHVTCAGYGAGKASACSAAAELIFNKYCDTIIVWGLAGGLSRRVSINDIVIGSRVAYRDFNIYPLFNSTGVGWVEKFSENVFFELDPGLRSLLREQIRKIFPERNVLEGTICTGDQFVEFKPGDALNRVERESDAVDMESAAVVHFCHNLNKKIKVGIVRVISDNADHNANLDFSSFLQAFEAMNGKLFQLRKALLEATCGNGRILSCIQDFPDFPAKGVLFKDIWGILSDREIFEDACHRLYDLFHTSRPDAAITKVAGVESRGFIFGFELAKMFGVPFVPLRKKGKLPGEVVSDTYRTEYSESCLEGRKSAFSPSDRVLLVDDIIATGGSLLAARNVIRKCGAACDHCLALGQINGLNGTEILKSQGLSATFLLSL